MKTKQQDHKLMDILKVKEISRLICETDMGPLRLKIRKGEENYYFVLDAVELPKEINKELFELLYPVKTETVSLVGLSLAIEELKKEVETKFSALKEKKVKKEAKNANKTLQ